GTSTDSWKAPTSWRRNGSIDRKETDDGGKPNCWRLPHDLVAMTHYLLLDTRVPRQMILPIGHKWSNGDDLFRPFWHSWSHRASGRRVLRVPTGTSLEPPS